MAAATDRSVSELDITPDEALFERDADTLVLAAVRNERPLAGLAGQMDWRLHGLISQALRCGAVTGAEDEFAYIPFAPHGRRMHLFVLGLGDSDQPGVRPVPSSQLWKRLADTCRALKISQAVLSRKDLGNPADDEIKKHMKGIATWVIP